MPQPLPKEPDPKPFSSSDTPEPVRRDTFKAVVLPAVTVEDLAKMHGPSGLDHPSDCRRGSPYELS